MKKQHKGSLVFGLIVRISFLIGIIILELFLFHYRLVYTSFFGLLILIAFGLELFLYVQNIFQFYDKTIEAILQNDFSANLTDRHLTSSNRNILKLYEKLKIQHYEHESKELVYSTLLNSLDSAVLILKKEKSWNIFLMNQFFANYFKVPKVSKWSYLKNHLESLCLLIEERNFEDFKTTIEITLEEQDPQTFVIQTARTQNSNQIYYVILLDSIQRVIDKKEKEAWINLMQIIAHELLNSLTPIQTLSQNLKEIVHQKELSSEDLSDIKESVNAINNRGLHLQQFVESYRRLTSLPTPFKSMVFCKEIQLTIQTLFEHTFKSKEIRFECNLKEDSVLYVDKNQFEQVLINLINNSIHALEGQEDKKISLNFSMDETRDFISVIDNGIGIASEIEDKIFIPFYTTRKNGAGIGLTLSKNIIEAQGGYLMYQKNEGKTVFTISLVR
ncbi:MAG: GHKL domain-containing protein [Flavobacteriia bacterium]|nr:GHKL domain-containing protein [Flavobacteriia bacterium]